MSRELTRKQFDIWALLQKKSFLSQLQNEEKNEMLSWHCE